MKDIHDVTIPCFLRADEGLSRRYSLTRLLRAIYSFFAAQRMYPCLRLPLVSELDSSLLRPPLIWDPVFLFFFLGFVNLCRQTLNLLVIALTVGFIGAKKGRSSDLRLWTGPPIGEASWAVGWENPKLWHRPSDTLFNRLSLWPEYRATRL